MTNPTEPPRSGPTDPPQPASSPAAQAPGPDPRPEQPGPGVRPYPTGQPDQGHQPGPASQNPQPGQSPFYTQYPPPQAPPTGAAPGGQWGASPSAAWAPVSPGRHARWLLVIPLVLVILGLLWRLVFVLPPLRVAVSRMYVSAPWVTGFTSLGSLLAIAAIITLVWLYQPPALFARVCVAIEGAWFLLEIGYSRILLPQLLRAMAGDYGWISVVSAFETLAGVVIAALEIVAIALALARHDRIVTPATLPGAPFAGYPPR